MSSSEAFQGGTTRFHYKIKKKGGIYEKCKVRLVVRGDRMTKKDDSGIGDFDDYDTQDPYILKSPFYGIPISASTWQLYTDATRPYRCGAILFF
jgi:hypothetical protein